MFIVFDLDGTLSNADHRQHFLEQTPRDWDSFHAAAVSDEPIWPLVETMRCFLEGGNHVEIWTGRSVEYQHQTLEWFVRHRIPTPKIRMRTVNDIHRPDTELKEEWMGDPAWGKPDLIFDDRTRSVKHWRSLGIVCCQVAQHDF